ncbi:MAG: GntR family transcriptional regulator [Armatimonadota bacterium]|nr:GntR family transcriptional regulator [bacterium]
MRRFSDELRIPKYVQLKLSIKDSIEDGRLAPNAKLLSRPEMADAYGVSHVTVTKALDELENEGYLYRLHGKGTFVAERKPDHKTLSVIIPSLAFNGDQVADSLVLDVTPNMVHYLEDEAYTHGWNIMLHISHYDPAREREYFRNTIEHHADGAIILYSGYKENLVYIREMKELNIPVVMIDSYTEDVNVDYVSTDNFNGAIKATNRLLDMGFERVCCLTSDPKSVPAQKRVSGYKAAMDDHRKNADVVIVPDQYDSDGWQRGGYEVVHNLLMNAAPSCAFFAMFPDLMKGAWTAISEVVSPEDRVGLACFDESKLDISGNVCMVEVLQPLEEIAKRSVMAVMENSTTRRETLRLLLTPEIRVTRFGESA